MPKIPFVDLYAQYLSIKNEIDGAINNVITETAFIGGKYVKQFEKQFSELLGVKHCISCANGTDAIYITLKMLGIEQGDEVITTAASWISTSETISQTGATPVFVDIDEYSTINADLIEDKISSRTRAIIVVHLYGQSADIKKIRQIADKHNLFLVEDCAQSHLTEFGGQYVGTFGHAATFSFYPGKNLGAYGDAGCIVTNNDELSEKLRMFANHGALIKHHHLFEGVNSRLDGLQSAILSAKLPYLKNWTKKRIENANYYTAQLKGVGDLVLPVVRNNTVHTFHLYVVKTSLRNELQSYLGENNIQTAIHYPKALPMLDAYKYLDLKGSDFPLAVEYQNRILSIPLFPELSLTNMDFIIKSIKDFYKSV
jgi:dTDP-4-amino-4,6-dideoxygalactose transaminase